jgi:hypothetical protein
VWAFGQYFFENLRQKSPVNAPFRIDEQTRKAGRKRDCEIFIFFFLCPIAMGKEKF